MASMLRKLTSAEVVFSVEATEDDLPVEGNAQVSDDEEADRRLCRELLLRRATGDVWAWAVVRVTATWKCFRGTVVLGGCSYANEAAFLEDAYYEDMKYRALEDLQDRLQQLYDNLLELMLDETSQLRRKVAEFEELLADDGK